jgi:hypothetical protein
MMPRGLMVPGKAYASLASIGWHYRCAGLALQTSCTASNISAFRLSGRDRLVAFGYRPYPIRSERTPVKVINHPLDVTIHVTKCGHHLTVAKDKRPCRETGSVVLDVFSFIAR